MQGVASYLRGSRVDLAAGDVGSGPRCLPLPGGREGGSQVLPVAHGDGRADGSEDGQPDRGADLAARIEQARPDA